MRALVLCCLVFVIQGCKNLPVDQAVQVGARPYYLIDKMTDGSLCATLTEVGIFAYGEEYNSRAMMFDKLTTQVIAGILKEQDAK